MQRKTFLLANITAIPSLLFGGSQHFADPVKKPFVVRAGKNRAGNPMLKFMGINPNDVIISRKDTGNDVSVFLFTGQKYSGTPLHLHFHQDEFFYVISGVFRFVCGDFIDQLTASDTIFLPKNIPHQWIQLSEQGHLLYAVNPAGTLEDMFQELSSLPKPPTDKELARILHKHGQQLLGPPLKS